MRLTLRTMLAHMDEVLEPADAEDVKKKIEGSKFASDLLQRIRDCVRLLRLPAPPLNGRGLGMDANSVAEYLNYTLPDERVPDFEKICLESDSHLAEVAACHQILALVLSEPADVDPAARERMYGLIDRNEPVAPPTQAPAIAPPVAAASPSMAAQGGSIAAAGSPLGSLATATGMGRKSKPQVPDYLRETRSSRFWPVAAVGMLAFVLASGVLALLAPPEWRELAGGWFQKSDAEKSADVVGPGAGLSEPGANTPERADPGANAVGPPSLAPEPGAMAENPAGRPTGPTGAVELAAPGGLPPSRVAGNSGVASSGVASSGAGPVVGDQTFSATSGGTPSGGPTSPELAPGAPTAPASADDSGLSAPSTTGRRPLGPGGIPGITDSTPPGNLAPNNPPVGGPDSINPAMTNPAMTNPAMTNPAMTNPAMTSPSATGPAVTIPGPSDAAALNPGPGVALSPAPASPPFASGAAGVLAPPQPTSPILGPGAMPDQPLGAPATPAAAPRESVEVGRYASEQDVVLRHEAATGAWRRLAPKSPIAVGDQLLSLPSYRPHFVLANGVKFEAVGPSDFDIKGFDPQGVFTIAVRYGRLIVSAEGVASSSVRFDFGDRVGLATFGDGSSSLALEVERIIAPGVDPETERAPLYASLFAVSGSVRWEEGGRAEVLQAPAGRSLAPTAMQLAGTDAPKWIISNWLKPIEKIGSEKIEKALPTDRPILLPLKELAESKQSEVRTLATRSAGYVGQFEPIVNALGNDDERNDWPRHLDTLRAALARGPETAAQVREAFEKHRGADAPRLYRMLWGYTLDQFKDGAAAELVEGLNSDSLDLRVLSFLNLQNMTGLSLFYRPESAPVKRRPLYLKWKDRVRDGSLMAKATAVAAAAKTGGRPKGPTAENPEP